MPLARNQKVSIHTKLWESLKNNLVWILVKEELDYFWWKEVVVHDIQLWAVSTHNLILL